MASQDILLSVNSFHLELIRPLVKWKILSIKELFEDSGYVGTYKNFQKIVTRLEKAGVVKGTKDVWTKSKRIWLTHTGNELVNPFKWKAHLFSEQTFFHDSRVTLYLRYLTQHLPVSYVELEQEKMKITSFKDLARIRPDAEFGVESADKRQLSILLEVELTQKSRERLIEKIEHYQQFASNRLILFVFPTESLFASYVRLFKSLDAGRAGEHHIFAVEPGLVKGCFSLENSKAYFRGVELSLRDVFTEILGRSSGDIKEKMQGLWRHAFERGL
jgi:hypothetical protein